MTLAKRSSTKIVAGLGKTGLSCVRFLKSRGYDVAVTDSRVNPPGLDELKQEFPDIELRLGGFDADWLQTGAEIIASPGIPVSEPALATAIAVGVPVIGDVEVFCREISAPVIAITGSNAKSTVTTLVGLMAEKAGINVGVGGNLGLPVLDMLRTQGEQALYVLELSSFQLETTFSLKAAVSTILNISEDHMDRYEDMSTYIAAKQRIYTGCRHCVFNRDDAQTTPPQSGSVTTTFGLTEPADGQFGVRVLEGKKWLAKGSENLLPVSALKIRGDHNVANALAALALGQAAAIPMSAMLEVLKTFTGLPHRCELVTEANAIGWYNDSKGTNVGSTLAAINGLGNAIDGKLVLIAGGVGKGQDFSPLSQPLEKFGRALVLIGEDGDKIGQAVSENVPHIHAVSLQDALEKCRAVAKPGDAVVLSPACASFDMFKNYEDRGHQFVAAVRAMVGGH